MPGSPGSRTGRPPAQRTVRRPAPRRTEPENPLRRVFTRLQRAWDRPLTAYYLIAGGSA
ncbi:cell division protein FtsW, partial [Streptomyces sp. TRM76130]|nr:cell division protein FtsW [Streptomyces sp. TRM76130]